MKRGRGRQPKLTPERQEKICALIRAGHYKKVAAAQSGISERNFYQWIARGDPEHPGYKKRYADFASAVEQAEAESELVLLDEIKKGGPREHLEILKRRFPERWGDRHRMEHSGPGDQPMAVNHSGTIQGPAPVQIIINQGDTWSEEDEKEAETDHDEQQKNLIKAADNVEIHMPSDTEDQTTA